MILDTKEYFMEIMDADGFHSYTVTTVFPTILCTSCSAPPM